MICSRRFCRGDNLTRLRSRSHSVKVRVCAVSNLKSPLLPLSGALRPALFFLEPLLLAYTLSLPLVHSGTASRKVSSLDGFCLNALQSDRLGLALHRAPDPPLAF